MEDGVKEGTNSLRPPPIYTPSPSQILCNLLVQLRTHGDLLTRRAFLDRDSSGRGLEAVELMGDLENVGVDWDDFFLQGSRFKPGIRPPKIFSSRKEEKERKVRANERT
jgi:hypothetical protein